VKVWFENSLSHLAQAIFKPNIHTYLPMKMEQTEGSETSAYKIQTSGTYSEENIQQPFGSDYFQAKPFLI
jgi:hypothetical protein